MTMISGWLRLEEPDFSELASFYVPGATEWRPPQSFTGMELISGHDVEPDDDIFGSIE